MKEYNKNNKFEIIKEITSDEYPYKTFCIGRYRK